MKSDARFSSIAATLLTKMARYHSKAKSLAEGLSLISGIEVFPPVPHTNMMHLVFAREAGKLQDAFAKIAMETRIWVFQKLQSLPDRTRCKAELNAGDATLDLETQNIIELFAQALSLSL